MELSKATSMSTNVMTAVEQSSDLKKTHLEVSKSNGICKTIGEKRKIKKELCRGSFNLE